MTPIDPLATAALVGTVLDELGIPYVIGGSVAASVFGEPRSTFDVDIMVDLGETQVRALVVRLGRDFYVDESDALDAVRGASSFNAIHFESSLKIDFFIAEPLGRKQIARRKALRVRSDLPSLYFYAVEDLIVRKLLWYRLGAASSERQWRDVVSLLKTSRDAIDHNDLATSAATAGVADLLRQAEADAAG